MGYETLLMHSLHAAKSLCILFFSFSFLGGHDGVTLALHRRLAWLGRGAGKVRFIWDGMQNGHMGF